MRYTVKLLQYIKFYTIYRKYFTKARNLYGMQDKTNFRILNDSMSGDDAVFGATWNFDKARLQ